MTETPSAAAVGSPRKLVYVLNQYSRSDASHAAHVIGLLEVLAARGVEIRLVIEKAVDIPESSVARLKIVGIRRPHAGGRFLELAKALRSAAREGFAVIFVRIGIPATLTALVASLGTGARVYYWQSGTSHALDRAAATGLRRIAWLIRSWWPFRLVVRGIHRFATGPEAMVAYYRDEVGVPERKLVCLYNDIHVEHYRNRIDRADRLAERSRLGASDATNVLLYVHRLSPVRRSVAYVSRLLEALRDPGHGPWILVFAGGGPEQGKLQEVIAQSGLGDRCRMLGNVPAGELPALYSAADIFLNPTYTEGFPRVILEAMVAGLPIVTTDAGGTAELLGPLQQRFVVPRQHSDRFALGVLDVMGDRELRVRLGRENLEAVRRFDSERVALMYEKELFG